MNGVVCIARPKLKYRSVNDNFVNKEQSEQILLLTNCKYTGLYGIFLNMMGAFVVTLKVGGGGLFVDPFPEL